MPIKTDLSACTLPRRAGVGLRSPHLAEVRAERPPVPWFEVHSENYFFSGGPTLEALLDLRRDYPFSLHGVGMSLGSAGPLDREHLRRLKSLVEIIEPDAVSEHLCWSSINGRSLNDLLPLPYTQEALSQVCAHISEVQDTLGRSILVENVSSYLRLFPNDMPEWEFVSAVSRHTGCGILLDVNNIYVNARNHGYDANDFLNGIALDSVSEIHLAGYEAESSEADALLIDTHSRPVYPAVWSLYQAALDRFGNVPTLIEWDHDLPAFRELWAEAEKAQTYMDAAIRNRADAYAHAG